ncbi:hypothetical protein NI17_014115 [Thermobifida halotolerans]|uniref:Uncharacterized protein n=1 Tax=Thermobifida halotolerans TaxID=483545 RepID=A0A399G3L1_9ACTN|nr:hypothetical protein [Thermobifida halotolerans]UOE17993.1 hypothetical protein NI17_014115 [Thermobifida halotolerans]
MANAWMPGARRVTGTVPAGRSRGGAPRAVWCVSESDPDRWSARAAARQLDRTGRTAHLVWNPVTGDIAQLLPATAAAAGQLTPAGSVDRALEGRVCILVQVVGRSPAPFTDSPLNGLTAILDWLDSWEIPRSWPAGPPGPLPPHRDDADRERLWAQGGHFGHSQVPGSAADGPGAIDVERMRDGRLPRPRQERPVASTAPSPSNGTRSRPVPRHD